MKSENYWNNPHRRDLDIIGAQWQKNVEKGLPLYPTCPLYCTPYKCYG